VIRLYEKQKGKKKDSDFSSKKKLMETIKDIRDMLPQLKSCPKSEQDIINKALSLVDKPKAEKKKEAPPIKEKIETPEEMFFRNLNFIEGQYLKNPGESGFVDINDSSRKKILRVLESIINKKKTSKFTKPEKEVLERVFRFYKSTRAPGQSKKDIENFESFLN